MCYFKLSERLLKDIFFLLWGKQLFLSIFGVKMFKGDFCLWLFAASWQQNFLPLLIYMADEVYIWLHFFATLDSFISSFKQSSKSTAW